MAGSKSAWVEQLLRSAAASVNAQTSDLRQRLDRDSAKLSQAGTTAAGRTVRRFRIWERYLRTWARAFVRAYAESAGQLGAPDAFAPQQLRRLRSAVESHAEIGIRALKDSVDMDHAAAADGSPHPHPERYEHLLAKVMAVADIEIEALAAERELRLLKLAAESAPVPSQLKLDDSSTGRQARLQRFLVEHGVKETDVAKAANVDKADLSRWKTGKLSASSSMAQRIEEVLRGERPLKRPIGQ
jgi:hypothetical protein